MSSVRERVAANAWWSKGEGAVASAGSAATDDAMASPQLL
jgi:hypothetical protein